MRPNRILITTLSALLALLAAAVAAVPVGAESTAPFFSESNQDINQDGNYIPLVGNFGLPGGPDDILWYAPGPNPDLMWGSRGDGSFAKTKLSRPVNGLYLPLVGDFAGDARDDIFWYGPGGYADAMWETSGKYQFTDRAVGVNGKYEPIVIPDRLGHDDILWWSRTGFSSVWSFTGNGSGHTAHRLSPPAGTQPVVGDFDGDGHGDIFWYGRGTGTDELWSGNGAGRFTRTAQQIGGDYEPFVNDFTPGAVNLQDDILWYNPKGASLLWHSVEPGQFVSSAHIIPAGRAVAADGEFGLLYIVRPGQPDWVWLRRYNSTSDVNQRSRNTEIGTGYQALVGNFAGQRDDIFWYKPGPDPEHLFYINLRS